MAGRSSALDAFWLRGWIYPLPSGDKWRFFFGVPYWKWCQSGGDDGILGGCRIQGAGCLPVPVVCGGCWICAEVQPIFGGSGFGFCILVLEFNLRMGLSKYPKIKSWFYANLVGIYCTPPVVFYGFYVFFLCFFKCFWIQNLGWLRKAPGGFQLIPGSFYHLQFSMDLWHVVAFRTFAIFP